MKPFHTAWVTLKGSVGGGMFQCDECGQTFHGQGQYQQHVQQTGHQTGDTGGSGFNWMNPGGGNIPGY